MLCQALGSTHITPWIIKGKWCKCLQIYAIINFKVTHVFREDNCVNRLINLGVKIRVEFAWYSSLPNSIRLNFFHNMCQLPLFCLYVVCSYFFFFFCVGLVWPTLFVICCFCFSLTIIFHVMSNDWWILGCQPN